MLLVLFQLIYNMWGIQFLWVCWCRTFCPNAT
jgi:hypothetical protein